MFIEIAKDIKKFLSSEENQASPSYRSESLLTSAFDGERVQIVEKLLGDPVYAAKFSDEYLGKLLEEKVRAMVQTLLQEGGNVRSQKVARSNAEALFNELDSYTTSVTVYLPVVGITLQLEEGKLEIGNITLQVMTQEKVDELQSQIVSTLMETSNTPDEKQAFISHFTKQI